MQVNDVTPLCGLGDTLLPLPQKYFNAVNEAILMVAKWLEAEDLVKHIDILNMRKVVSIALKEMGHEYYGNLYLQNETLSKQLSDLGLLFITHNNLSQ